MVPQHARHRTNAWLVVIRTVKARELVIVMVTVRVRGRGSVVIIGMGMQMGIGIVRVIVMVSATATAISRIFPRPETPKVDLAVALLQERDVLTDVD